MTSMYGSNEVGFKNCENEMQKILNAFIVSLFGKDVLYEKLKKLRLLGSLSHPLFFLLS